MLQVQTTADVNFIHLHNFAVTFSSFIVKGEASTSTSVLLYDFVIYVPDDGQWPKHVIE
jgi:hypothetical protein